MPGRSVALINDHVYHVFNRGIDHCPTFTDKRELKRAASVIDFYRFVHPPVKFSKLLQLPNEIRADVQNTMKTENKRLVEFFTYCFMSNHFHFLIRQLQLNGISKFLANFLNSYTKYFNTKHERDGALFLNQFKAVMIETDEQFLHVSRYIHLNPLTAGVVKNFSTLLAYPWSSLPEYVRGKEGLCNISEIMSFFKTKQNLMQFIKDQVDYQKELHRIKHLILE